MRRKRLNVTRRVGRFYFRVERGRYHDGSPDGRLVLWVTTARGTGYDGPGSKSRFSEYIYFAPDAKYPLSRLSSSAPLTRDRTPVQIAHAIRQQLINKLESRL